MTVSSSALILLLSLSLSLFLSVSLSLSLSFFLFLFFSLSLSLSFFLSLLPLQHRLQEELQYHIYDLTLETREKPFTVMVDGDPDVLIENVIRSVVNL